MAGEERRVSTTPACSAVAAVTLTLAQVASDLALLLRPSPQAEVWSCSESLARPIHSFLVGLILGKCCVRSEGDV